MYICLATISMLPDVPYVGIRSSRRDSEQRLCCPQALQSVDRDALSTPIFPYPDKPTSW